ncbi:6272_t:CDS:2 [Funneliformis caledonium]|uniref:6272_t:CDS:1 n=1 Tax=Funneliformis caledonium TaxID=1117310 RepID=A0A9N9FWE5_9GLOM|nr:6272_t:CDS:2 [Funneliformis caledonium]
MLIFGFAAKTLIVAYATLALALNHTLILQCTDMHEVARHFEELS